MSTTTNIFGRPLRHASLGSLVALVFAFGASRAGADEPPSAGITDACENACHAIWQTLVNECKQLTGSAKAQCLREAREEHEACLDGCFASSAPDEQALAEEKTVIYYSEPAKIHRVGLCSGPFHCFGPKGLVCTGTQTPYQTVTYTSCDPD